MPISALAQNNFKFLLSIGEFIRQLKNRHPRRTEQKRHPLEERHRMVRFIKTAALNTLLVLLAGCSALPRSAYPILEFDDVFNFSDISSVEATRKKIVGQQKAYWERANQAREGSMDARTSVMAGATVGVVGALIRNVATTAAGAAIAAGGALLDQQYSLAAQDQIFSQAAARAGCIVIVSNAAASTNDALLLQGAAYAVLAKVQSSLADLKPMMPTTAGLMEAYLARSQAHGFTGDESAEAKTIVLRSNLKSCIETGQLPDDTGNTMARQTQAVQQLGQKVDAIGASLKQIKTQMDQMTKSQKPDGK